MTTTSPAFGGRRRRGAATALTATGVLLAGAFWAAAPASAAPAEPCAGGEMSVDGLAQWNRDRACDLVGRTIRAGRTSAVVPPRGTSVTAHVLFVDGEEELTVTTAADGSVTATTEPAAAADAAAAAPTACNDHASNLMGIKWPVGSTYRWFYHPANQAKSKLTAAEALNATKNATKNVAIGFNDCGLSAKPKVFQAYAGTTSAAPNVTNGGGCSASDGKNVAGWGDMGGSGPLGVTCNWSSSGTIVASDMKVNFRYDYWNGKGSCPAGRYDYQSVATHERGHTFGLGHVDGTAHPTATMTPAIGPCNKSKRTLDAGEHQALITMYGRR
ncbi:matrixin family metalloprotease [Mangrovihabitans endophyticus]|uniref:Peptidase M10 metallopeptidase domain-containing protein n=1 Tax=Mangrovihabitans endophyticus TaxID=1751298 RepID=A0A8J3BZD8_9ACTN|nr:matrixin family metalloprotease [Mangrovihabitans endophyticus]GGK88304.1 hypothetical protein GCM10012284_22930 [Mangrovihabitans endophyticus]